MIFKIGSVAYRFTAYTLTLTLSLLAIRGFHQNTQSLLCNNHRLTIAPPTINTIVSMIPNALQVCGRHVQSLLIHVTLYLHIETSFRG
jgi:hypothetical protein